MNFPKITIKIIELNCKCYRLPAELKPRPIYISSEDGETLFILL